MKTKLFSFLFFLTCAFSFSQITLNESFESGLPAGWSNSNYSVTTAASCSGSQSLTASLFTSGSNANLQTTSYISNGNAITFSYSYKAQVYSTDNFIARLYYEVNNTNTWTQVNTNTIFSASCQTLSATLAVGVVPAGTPIRFRAQINRMTGGGVVYIDDVIITQVTLGPTAPSITSLSVNSITSTSAIINYNLNANNSATTSIVKYGLNSGNLTSQIVGFSASGNANTPGNVSINGLSPNTQYFYQVEATNSEGTVSSIEGNFTTLANPMSEIAEYNFDNTYNNILGSRPFTANTGTSFTTDRNGNANAALNLVSIGTTATIPNLPYDLSPRTISIWVKNYTYNWFVASACPFSYGTTSNTYELAIYETSFNLNPYSSLAQGHNVDLTPLSITNALNVWNHYVVSYDGTTSKIYKDGVLLSTLNVAIIPTSNNSDIFKLGLLNAFTSDYFDGAIDDLKIYNYALTDTDVTNLYTNNTLTSENFNLNSLEVKLYPNPVQDILNIEIEKDIKSIGIYNIQGQKVLSSNQKQINISDLATGMYLVRIQDAENNIATVKIVIK